MRTKRTDWTRGGDGGKVIEGMSGYEIGDGSQQMIYINVYQLP